MEEFGKSGKAKFAGGEGCRSVPQEVCRQVPVPNCRQIADEQVSSLLDNAPNYLSINFTKKMTIIFSSNYSVDKHLLDNVAMYQDSNANKFPDIIVNR